MKELNKILRIEIKLSTALHLQTDRQIERTNQELEQHTRMYIDYRQNNWLRWLATAEFVFNNKVHIVTKLSLFKINCRKKLRMNFEIRKEKHVKVEKFVKEMQEIYKKAKVTLKKLQKKIKKYADKNRKEAMEYKVGDKVLLSIY